MKQTSESLVDAEQLYDEFTKLAQEQRVNEANPSAIPSTENATHLESKAAPPLKLTTESGAFIPEVFNQVLKPANCGVSGHFWFQENGGNCLMCQRTAAMEIENNRLRQAEQHFLNQQKIVASAIESIWPSLQFQLMKQVYATIPVGSRSSLATTHPEHDCKTTNEERHSPAA